MYAYWMNGEEAAARHPSILVGPRALGHWRDRDRDLPGRGDGDRGDVGRPGANRPLYYLYYRTAYRLRSTIAMLPSGD